MKHLIIFLIAMLTTSFAYADIYKSVDGDGNTSYKDIRDDDAHEYVPPSMNAIPMPKWQSKPKPPVKPRAFRYHMFAITAPAADEVFHNTEGGLTVSITIQPTLLQGHTIKLLLDGKTIVSHSRKLSHPLKYVDRGSHIVSAEVYSAKDELIGRSEEVRFHIKRHSSQQDQQQVGPRDSAGKLYQPGPRTDRFKPGPSL